MSTQLSCVHTQLALSKSNLTATDDGAVELPVTCNGCGHDMTARFESDSPHITDDRPHTTALELDTDGGLSVVGYDETETRAVEFDLVEFKPESSDDS